MRKSLISPISPTSSRRCRQLARRSKLVRDGEIVPGVDHLPAVSDLEKLVAGGVVAHLDVMALFEAVWDDPPVLAVA